MNLWDSRKPRARGNLREAKQVNQLLEITRSYIYQSYLDLEEDGSCLKAQATNSRFLGEDQQNDTLRDLIAYHNEKNQQVPNKFTLRHYETTQRYLMEYGQKEYKTHLFDKSRSPVTQQLNDSNFQYSDLDEVYWNLGAASYYQVLQ